MGYVTKDSGKRVNYATGARRDTNEGKGRFDLLPAVALARVAQLYQRGEVKYGPHNWEKGIPSSRFLDSLLRHAFQISEGERTEDHKAAVVFNALGLMFNEEMVKRGRLPAALLDLRDYTPKARRSPGVSGVVVRAIRRARRRKAVAR